MEDHSTFGGTSNDAGESESEEGPRTAAKDQVMIIGAGRSQHTGSSWGRQLLLIIASTLQVAPALPLHIS